MGRNITTVQRESIVLDAAVLFANYGETDQREIGITKGGAEFAVKETIRHIDYDGKRGPTMGMEVVDDVEATLKVSTLECTLENLMLTLGAATKAATSITNTQGGIIPDARYLKNLTAFGKHNATGKFKKITIFNALGAGGFTLKTTDKGEATVDIVAAAHWNPADLTDPLYNVTDDTTGPVDPA